MRNTLSGRIPREVVDAVLRDRRLSALSNRQIAKRHELGRSTVDRIVKGKHVLLAGPPARRCECGRIAPATGCVACMAARFRVEVDAVVDDCLRLCHEPLPTTARMRRLLTAAELRRLDGLRLLIAAAAESRDVAEFLAQCGERPNKDLLEDLTPEARAAILKKGVRLADLGRLIPLAWRARSVSRENPAASKGRSHAIPQVPPGLTRQP